MADDSRRWRRYGFHLGLFFATCLTTTWAGAAPMHADMSWLKPLDAWPQLADGLPFSIALMAILLSHEMGHYVVARLHGVRATLPIFLPFPMGLIGTLGAVISMPSMVRNRNALVDIGAAGPLAGLVVALPVLAYGLHLSPLTTPSPNSLVEGNSLLYFGMKYAIKGMALPGPGVDVQLHPVAWAGWVGLLVTMINLLPIGQLDGGHIAHGYFGNRHDLADRWLHRALPVLGLGVATFVVQDTISKVSLGQAVQLGLMAAMPWFVWWVLLRVMRAMGRGRYHPPVDDAPLTAGRRKLCWLMLAILVLIAMPIPLRMGI